MPIYLIILAVGFVFLPFTKALTVDVGFPLKFYEGIFAAAVASVPFSARGMDFRFAGKIYLPMFAGWLVATIAYFTFVYTAGSSLIDLNVRGGAAIDGISRVAYLLLNLGIIVALTLRSQIAAGRFLGNAWLLGMLISAAYLFYCNFSLLIFDNAVLLPGLDRHQLGSFGPITTVRSGTFEEGNFGGFYYLLSLVIAAHYRNYVVAGIALFAVLLTQSTAAYFGMLLFFGMYFIVGTKVKSLYLVYIVAGALLAFGVFAFFASQGKFEMRAGASGGVRLNDMMTGVRIFLDNPIFGVGLGQFDRYYDYYIWDYSLYIPAETGRRIVNNVYVEILCEVGVVGFFFFALFFRNWLKHIGSGGLSMRAIYAGGISMLLVFLAYPTFNIAFIWCFMGLALLIRETEFLPDALVEPGPIARRRVKFTPSVAGGRGLA